MSSSVWSSYYRSGCKVCLGSYETYSMCETRHVLASDQDSMGSATEKNRVSIMARVKY